MIKGLMLTSALVSMISMLNTYKANAADGKLSDEMLPLSETPPETRCISSTVSSLNLDPDQNRIRLPLTSIAQMKKLIDYLKKITTDASKITNREEQKQKYELAIQRCNVDYTFPEDALFQDVLPFLFTQTVTHVNTLLALTASNTYTETSENYLKKAADLIKKHTQFYYRCSAAKVFQMTGLAIQGGNDAAQLNMLGQDVCTKLATLSFIGGKEERKVYDILLEAISHGESSIKFSDPMIELAEKMHNYEEENLIKHRISQRQLLLMHNYFDVCQYSQRNDPSLYSTYYKKMKSIHEVLKNDPIHSSESQKWMNAVTELKNMLTKTSGSGRGILANYADLKTAKDNHKLQQIISSISDEGAIIQAHYTILAQIDVDIRNAIARNKIAQPGEIPFDSLDKISAMENSIFEGIDFTERTESLDDKMLSIYREYRQILGSSIFDNAVDQYMLAFLYAGDIDGAFTRTKTIETILIENNIAKASTTRWLIALIKNLNGDHSDWFELVEESARKSAEKKAKKTQRKKAAHAEMLDSIMRTQKVQTENEIAILKSEEEKKLAIQLKKEKSKSAKEEHPSDAHIYYDNYTPTSKKTKLLHHKEHIEERKKEKEETENVRKISHSELSSSSSSASSSTGEVSNNDAFNLGELYNLTGVALMVDQLIKEDNWDFTRENLFAYYEAMGCERKSGKGSHERIDFTKSSIFTKQGKIIAILSDFGGALTLPRWENTVPHYLRKQIRIASANLAKSAEKVAQTLNESSNPHEKT